MRLAFSRKSDLALRSLVVLLRSGEALKGSDLASTVDTSPAFLVQVLAPLVRQGWVESSTGPHGGYRLRADPQSLSVLAVIESIEGSTDDHMCVMDRVGPCTPGKPCPLHQAWKRARQALLSELEGLTIADLPPVSPMSS